MLKKKEQKGIGVEVGLNLGPLIESLGVPGIVDKVLKMIQQGKIEAKVEVGLGKKRKVPVNFTIRLKKAEG